MAFLSHWDISCLIKFPCHSVLYKYYSIYLGIGNELWKILLELESEAVLKIMLPYVIFLYKNISQVIKGTVEVNLMYLVDIETIRGL